MLPLAVLTLPEKVRFHQKLNSGDFAGTSDSQSRGFYYDPIQNEYIATFSNTNSIKVFPANISITGNLNIKPSRVIAGSNTQMLAPLGLALYNGEIYVINSESGNGVVTVFNQNDNGNVSSKRTIAGTSTQLNSTFTQGIAVASGTIYITSQSASGFQAFSTTANGNVAPIFSSSVFINNPYGVRVSGSDVYISMFSSAPRGFCSLTLSGASTGSNCSSINIGPDMMMGFDIDATNNLLYATMPNLGGGSKLYVFTLSQTYTGTSITSTQMGQMTNVGYDSTNHELYTVTNNLTTNPPVGGLEIYDPTTLSPGVLNTVSPVRQITGLQSGVSQSYNLTADLVNDQIWVTNFGTNSLSVFANGSNGASVIPAKTIIGAATGLNGPHSVAVDTQQNLVFVSNLSGNTITVYSRTASGNATPLRTITGLNQPQGLFVDSVSQTLYVANAGTNAIFAFSESASGAATPLRKIIGNQTQLASPFGVYFDSAHSDLWVTNPSTNLVSVFASTANGNVAPIRTLSGSATGLNGPTGIVVNDSLGEAVIANGNNGNLLVFNSSASGDVGALRSLRSSGALHYPQGLALCN